MNLGPQKISTTYQLVLNQSGGAVTLGDGTTPNWIGSTIASTTGTQTISGVKTFQNDTIFNGSVGMGTTTPDEKLHVHAGDIKVSRGSYEDSQYLILTTNSSNGGELISYSAANSAKALKIQATTTTDHDLATAGDPYISFKTYDTERMRITSGGYVGIGTSSPACSLDIEGGIRVDGGSPGVGGISNNGYAFNSPGDTDAGMFSSADGQIEFYTNNSERIKISGANVGINKSNPNSKLEVAGQIISSSIENSGHIRMIQGNYATIFRNDGSDFYLLLTDSGKQYGSYNTLRPFIVDITGGNVQINTRLGVGVADPSTKFEVNGTAKATTLQSDRLENTEGNEAILLEPSDDSISFVCNSNKRMHITSAGKVGIGTTTPSYSLDVRDGGIATIGSLSAQWQVNQFMFGDTTHETRYWMGTRGTGDNNNAPWKFYYHVTGASPTYHEILSVLPDSLNSTNYSLKLKSSQIVVNSSNNVGIGTGSPTEKLHVNGNLKVDGLISTNTITATNGFAIPNQSAKLAADFDMRTKDQVYNILSISLTAGTWLVNAHLTYNRTNTTANSVLCRISDGVNHYASAEAYRPGTANLPISLQVTTIITLASATTIILQAQQNGTSVTNATTSVAKASTVYGASPGATQINAVKIG
jgi:hypothetical protein